MKKYYEIRKEEAKQKLEVAMNMYDLALSKNELELASVYANEIRIQTDEFKFYCEKVEEYEEERNI